VLLAVGELADLAVVDVERHVDQHPQVGQAHARRPPFVLEHGADPAEERGRVAAVMLGRAAQHHVERDRVGQRGPAGALRGRAGRLQQRPHPAGLAVPRGEDGQCVVFQWWKPTDVERDRRRGRKCLSHDPALRTV
jgi:hypothetical protein